MCTFSKSVARILGFGIVALMLAATIAPAHADRGVIVFQPGSKPYGKSYGEWGAAWWQWAYSIPVSQNPLFDETGAFCDQGQSGPVWYLAGVFNVSGTAHRSCSVPKGTALFFPLVNVEWDNVCPPSNLTIDELRGLAASIADLITDLTCEVDGVPIEDPFRFRTKSDPFSVTFPDGNVFQFFGCDVPPGTYFPFVGDGYYVMLAPLPAGHHTVRFGGTIGPPIGFSLDVVYDIEVVNRHGAETAAAAASPSAAPQPWFKQGRTLDNRSGAQPLVEQTRRAADVVVGPNPLRDEGVLRFTLTQAGRANVRLFDLGGRVVRTLADRAYFQEGAHELRVRQRGDDGTSLSPGMYFYSIETDREVIRGRVAVLK